MLQRIIAIGETWIQSFEPELKCQSSEWYTRNSPRPVKFYRSQNCAKMLMIVAYDFRGLLTAHRLPTCETVNKEYYKTYIGTILCLAIRRKHQEMIDRTLLILHDNASPLKANIVKELLESFQWEVFDYPPYSPDLSPLTLICSQNLRSSYRGYATRVWMNLSVP